MKRIIYSLFLCIFSTLYSETIFYKTNGTIPEDEYKTLYDILLTTQFPTCTLYKTCSNYDQENAEPKLIAQQILKQLPESGIKSSFIPTTLYQLFAVNFIRDLYEKNFKDFHKFVGLIERCSTSIEGKIKSPLGQQISPNEFERKLNNDKLINFSLLLNNYIVDNLIKLNFNLPLSLEDALASLDLIYEFWEPIIGGTGCFEAKMCGQNMLDKDFIGKIITLEYDAENKNKFMIYRSENSSKYKPNFNHSTSYSSTFLGGIIFDKTACAGYYIFNAPYSHRPTEDSYALLIDKKQYAEGPLNRMFYIPPITSLLDTISSGEFFHSRTKVVNLNKTKQFFAKDISQLSPFAWHYQIYAKNKEEAENIYKDGLKYVQNNSIILRGKLPNLIQEA